ncbi:MAG: AMP-binding protein [Oscillospiraceae bacterium]|nr:AMP-binding protein [Oscillospiraceae bacterium]
MNNIKTLKDLLYDAAERFGDKVFLKYIKNDIVKEKSFNRLKEDAMQISSMMTYMSPSGPCNVSLIGTTTYEYIAVYFGIVSAQCSAVTLDAKLSIEDLCSLIRRSDSRIVFLDNNYIGYANAILNRCPYVHCIVNMQSDESGDDARSLRMMMKNVSRLGGPAQLISSELKREPKPEDCATIIYTSGTTGVSKGVMLSHANLVDNVFCSDDKFTPDDVKLTLLPINHAIALTADMLNGLRFGYTLCINDSMMKLEKNLKLFEPTTMIVVPMIAESLLKRVRAKNRRINDIKKSAREVFGNNFNMIFTGGAPLRPETIAEYQAMGFDVCQGYGMTECSPKISTGIPGDPFPDSCGRLSRGCDIRVVDGEIQVKSPSVMMGYYKDEENTKAAFTEDGWLRTGDIGHVVEQDNVKFVYITGRLKNLIITNSGENVSPEELEEKINAEDVISEVVVYAKDTRIVAEIIQNSDATGTESSAEAESIIQGAIDRINEGLPLYKRIQTVKMRDEEFEKTTSGKIKRRSLGQ